MKGGKQLTVTGVLDREAQVHVTGEIDTELYLCGVLDVDRVRGVAPKRTCAIGFIGGHTGAPLEEGPHH